MKAETAKDVSEHEGTTLEEAPLGRSGEAIDSTGIGTHISCLAQKYWY